MSVLRRALCACLLALSCSRAINAQVCAPGLPCDVNVLVTGIQGFLFEDDVKTCLQCAFDGVNSTTAVWSRPAGSIVAPFGSVSNGVLEICNTEEFISLGPSVVLTCTQTSSHQIIGNFRIFTPPVISPDIATIDEGETLSLACETTSNPLGGFTWYGPDGLLINNEISFTIPNITRDASGPYTCVIEDDRNENLNSTQTITVQFAPELMTADPSQENINLGDGFSRTCTFVGVPFPDVTWYQNTTMELVSGVGGVTIVITGSSTTLSVAAADRNSGGSYMCFLENVVGTEMQLFDITILIPPAPADSFTIGEAGMMEIPVTWQTGYDGGSPILRVEIDISTSAFPSVPSIPFEVGATQTFLSGSSGIVTSLAAFTNYTFALYVVNEVGRSDPLVRTVMTLSLRLGSPSVTLTADTSTQLTLTWTPPTPRDTTDLPSQWTVQYGLAAAGSSLTTELILDPSNRTLPLPDLQKGTSYQARVAGSNSVGLGEYSDFEVEQTQVDPPSAPLNLVVTGPGATALNISWLAPTDDGGRPVDRYLLEIRATAQVQFSNLTTVTDTFHFQRMQSVFVLVENTTYEVRVSAVNEAGAGDTVMEFGTTQSIEEPQTIFDEPMDSTVTNISAVISWEASGGFVDNYTIFYQLANDDTVFTVTTEDNTTTTIMLINLTPSSAYLAFVVTNNQNGASDPSPVIQFSTQSAPPPIIDGPASEFAGTPVSLFCSSPLSAAVEWSRPNAPLPAGHVLSNAGANLTIPEPEVGDSGVYVCTVGSTMQNHSLVIREPDEVTQPVSTEVIIGVCVAGGVALLIFVVVVLVACCYCCRGKSTKKAASYNLKPKNKNMNWIETSANQHLASTGQRVDPDAAASGFNIPEDYQTHSSFNTMEKQHVVTPSAGTHGSREDLVPSGEEGAGFQYVGEEAAQYTTYPSSHTNTTV